MIRRAGWFLAGVLAGALLISPGAQAARIRVSQESKPAAGDFERNILGHLNDVLAAEKTAPELYTYDEFANYSYNGRRPVLRADTSHLFFVRAKEGLTLFLVHDKPNNPDGGVAVTRIDVEGNSQAARMLVQDDPDGQRDTYEAGPRGTFFTAWHMWNVCCTDGLVTGPYAGNWRIYVRFLEPPQGIRNWVALSADGSEISLRPEPGRRVRLEPMGMMVRRSRGPRFPGPRLPVPVRLLW